MKTAEIKVNQAVAEKFNRELEFVAETGEGNGKKPSNGAYVLVHYWEAEDDEGEQGYDSWDVVRWYEAGTVVDAGIDASESKSKDRIIRVLEGKPIKQEIKKSGFYWQDGDPLTEGKKPWYYISEENVDCWCELKPSEKGKIKVKDEKEEKKAGREAGTVEIPIKEVKKESKIDCSDEVMFRKSYRLANGDKMTIETINSQDWGEGKLPDDVAAFQWWVVTLDGTFRQSGKFSARFQKPVEGDWDEDEVAEQAIRCVLKKKFGIKNPDGLYDKID